MGNPSNTNGADPIKIDSALLKQNIEDVYIGVFFDGTNNNMLWSARKKIKEYSKKLNVDKLTKKEIDSFINSHKEDFETYCKDKKSSNEELDTKKAFIKNEITKEQEKAANVYNAHSDFKGENKGDDIDLFIKSHLTKENKDNIIKKHEKAYRDYKSKKLCDKMPQNCVECEVNKRCEEKVRDEFIKKLIVDGKYEDEHAIRIYRNAHTDYKPTMLGGFSNIAILYSVYNPEPNDKTTSKTYKIYIEGSGATDITNNNALESEMNINGLGFGLGNTGVVALVSKAVYYVNNYIESIKSAFKDQKVKIHFNVFGFSRGATCSRLFSYLVTRGDTEDMGEREKEFADFYAKSLYKKKGNNNAKLHFLENTAYDKTVDFLGIYDTVVSIGFLLQKDGYVNPLAIGYKNKITGIHADNYIANWHCNNVSEYGMYCTSKKYNEEHKGKINNILHICAMDEYRENFALTNVGKTVGDNAVEIYIPGCHSDVGGGYYDGDEEQEILLRKSVQKGEYPKDWEKRRTTKNVFGYNAHLINPWEKKVYWGKYHYQKSDDKSFIIAAELVFGKEFTEKHIKKNIDLKSGLKVLGWIDENWSNENERKKIILNGDPVPCTIRITDGPKYVKFKRNVKAGYSNIPLNMMIDYATNQLKDLFTNLFDSTYIKEYPIPNDLTAMSTAIKDITLIKANRYWIHPRDEDYKKLRMKYLHFTSTYRLYHTNNPFSKDVKTFEGSPGNIANTPNQDLDGRICRIVYHGDRNDYDLNYMYEYGENLGSVHGNISAPITFATDNEI